jgi:uncharacterized protein YerC
MPRISRSHLSKNQLNDVNQHFLYLISSLANTKDVEAFLEEFLTTEEKVMLAKRLVLFMMLAKEYPEDSIKNILHFSHETIRTYKNNFVFKSASFHANIQKLIKKERSKQFFKKLEKILDLLATLSASKTSIKARRKILSGEW